MNKKAKAGQPVAVRVIKNILVVLGSAILIAAIIARIVHFYQHHISK